MGVGVFVVSDFAAAFAFGVVVSHTAFLFVAFFRELVLFLMTTTLSCVLSLDSDFSSFVEVSSSGETDVISQSGIFSYSRTGFSGVAGITSGSAEFSAMLVIQSGSSVFAVSTSLLFSSELTSCFELVY